MMTSGSVNPAESDTGAAAVFAVEETLSRRQAESCRDSAATAMSLPQGEVLLREEGFQIPVFTCEHYTTDEEMTDSSCSAVNGEAAARTLSSVETVARSS